MFGGEDGSTGGGGGGYSMDDDVLLVIVGLRSEVALATCDLRFPLILEYFLYLDLFLLIIH
jgi:hypothetical protein